MKPAKLAATLSPLGLLCMGCAFGQSGGPATATPELDTIVVTGTATNLDAARDEIAVMPGGASLIDLNDFRERHVGSLADVLLHAPGIWAASHSGNDSLFFSSRGSNLDATPWDMNGIKLLQDGLPVTSADGNNHNRVIDPLAARYATVARGANALSFGASTLGGAVNFVTPTARDSARVEAVLNAGSHGQRLGRVTLGNVFGEAWDAQLTLEGRRWDGYRDHNRQRRAGLYANAGRRISPDLTTRFFVTWLDNDQQLPGSLNRAEFDANPDRASQAAIDGDYQLNVDTRRLANRTSWRIDEHRRLDVGLSVEKQALYHPIVWVAVGGVEIFSLLIDTDQRDVSSMARYQHRIGDHELLFGLNYGESKVDGGNYRNLAGQPNGLRTLVHNTASTAEVFAMDRWGISDRTTLVLAVQGVFADRQVRNIDVSSGTVNDPGDRYQRVNPRVGAVHATGRDFSVYANLSGLFEPPTNFELEDNVAGGSATLKAMKGRSAEVGTRGERAVGAGAGAGGRWNWDVSLYYARIDDEILSVEDPDAPGTSLSTNIDATIHAGIEAATGAVLPLGRSSVRVEPRLSFTVNEFRFDDDPVYGNNRLPAAPRYFARGEWIFRGRNGFHIGPTFDLVGRRWADFANTWRVDSHRLLGLRTGWSSDRWRIFAELRNLGDENYVASHGVRNAAGPAERILNPGEPRSVYIGVQGNLR